MKKIKKIVSLACASLVMGGLIFSAPKNTTIANAGVVPTDPKYYREEQTSIKGFYRQRLCFKTIKRGTYFKPYCSMMLQVASDGMLKMGMHEGPIQGLEFDDNYTLVVFDKDFNLRFRFTTNYYCQATVLKELQFLIEEFNKLKVGVGNYLGVIGERWEGTVLWDTRPGFSALIRIGYNNFEVGYTDLEHKFGTLLEVTDDGLKETKHKWFYRVWKHIRI